ncbi:ferritin family protein [Candidatus Bipolaricaulota bacterium]|nr:ferritin family protein [Candidatus Bipolaricaulota bacterium]
MEEKLNSFDLKQIIGYSIESENKSKEFYGKFVESGKGQLVPGRFKSLMEDEQLHKEVLLDLHEELYGNKDYEVPKTETLPPHEDFNDLGNVENLIDALDKAITNENNAIRIYEYLADAYEEGSDIFGYLASMEHGHYESLKKEKSLYEREAESPEEEGLSEGIWKRLGLGGM